MALSAFDDKATPPQDEALRATLGRALAAWEDLRKRIADRFSPLSAEWNFASKSAGWVLRLRAPKRTVLYMTPCARHFVVSFALGEKAVAAAHAAELPATALTVIDSARKYVEGRAVRFEVRTRKDVKVVERVAEIKMQN